MGKYQKKETKGDALPLPVFPAKGGLQSRRGQRSFERLWIATQTRGLLAGDNCFFEAQARIA